MPPPLTKPEAAARGLGRFCAGAVSGRPRSPFVSDQVAGYQYALWVSVGIVVLAMLATLLLPTPKPLEEENDGDSPTKSVVGESK